MLHTQHQSHCPCRDSNKKKNRVNRSIGALAVATQVTWASVAWDLPVKKLWSPRVKITVFRVHGLSMHFQFTFSSGKMISAIHWAHRCWLLRPGRQLNYVSHLLAQKNDSDFKKKKLARKGCAMLKSMESEGKENLAMELMPSLLNHTMSLPYKEVLLAWAYHSDSLVPRPSFDLWLALEGLVWDGHVTLDAS